MLRHGEVGHNRWAGKKGMRGLFGHNLIRFSGDILVVSDARGWRRGR